MKQVMEFMPWKFREMFPDAWESLPEYLKLAMAEDDRYIIRIISSAENILMEIGYLEDDWVLE